ncbi:MAG: hypothetical protein GXO75_19025 [Calditrichaeota bacterium]|nr:hypothetical protein [Calditrichota bacterium]
MNNYKIFEISSYEIKQIISIETVANRIKITICDTANYFGATTGHFKEAYLTPEQARKIAEELIQMAWIITDNKKE